MTPLHMIEIRPDLTVLLRFLHSYGLDPRDGDEDMGYGVHAWLAAAFGELAPKPWRLFAGKRQPPRILGYSRHDADKVRQRLREFADPGVFAVCRDPDSAITGKPMPTWRSGRRLAYELQCCPVGRKAGTGIEKDLFLIHTDQAGEQAVERGVVYANWVAERLQRDQAATVTSTRLVGFRLVRQTRQSQGVGARRRPSHLTRPQALLRGELIVEDPMAFAALLARGIGRHRSFGYGMLLLRPPS